MGDKSSLSSSQGSSPRSYVRKLIYCCGLLVALVAFMFIEDRSNGRALRKSFLSLTNNDDANQKPATTLVDGDQQQSLLDSMEALSTKLTKQQETIDLLRKQEKEEHDATAKRLEEFSSLLQEKFQNLATKQDMEDMSLQGKQKLMGSGSDGASNVAPPPPTTTVTAMTTTTATTMMDPQLEKALLNNPPIPETAGQLKLASNMAPFEAVKPTLDKFYVDGEDYDILHHYLWGQENGIVMELGALDGQKMSVSKPFLNMGWHRLLVEANPIYAARGPTLSPDATYVHAAICDPDRYEVVHYLQKNDQGINGIAEFMSRGFFSAFHKKVYQATNDGTDFARVSNWTEWNANSNKGETMVYEVPCLNLNTLFDHLGMTRVNFFMLDVEGAELNILQSLDYTKIQFDVLIVETEPKSTRFREKGYYQKVIDFLTTKGYVFDQNVGRNSWFHHSSFVPVKDPSLPSESETTDAAESS